MVVKHVYKREKNIKRAALRFPTSCHILMPILCWYPTY